MRDAPISLEHAVRTASKWRARDEAAQARTDLAELMAEGCPSVREAARQLRMSFKRADIHWQAIKRDLGVAQCQ